MAVLLNGSPQKFPQGDYCLVIDYTSGEVILSISINGGTFIPIEDGAFTSNATKILHLPECEIRNDSTGTSVVDLSKARAFGN